MTTTERRQWTRAEVLRALSLYCVLPFGRFHKSNPDVIALAQELGRTPGSVALKLCNLASLDPHERARGIAGMTNASTLDREVWKEFYGRWDELAAALPLKPVEMKSPMPELELPDGPTEREVIQKIRRGQQFFRKAVLSAYADQCCITGIAETSLLRASHIVPWSESEEHRLNPSNGLCLNALHDSAFEAGLITFDERFRLVIARKLSKKMPKAVYASNFEQYKGQEIKLPDRFRPDEKLLKIHRARKFKEA
jgi:hypothetical protein